MWLLASLNSHLPVVLNVYGGLSDSQLKNPAFLLLCLGATFDSLIISGTATFGAKLLQQFFMVDLTMAGTIMGKLQGRGWGRLGGKWDKRLGTKGRGEDCRQGVMG